MKKILSLLFTCTFTILCATTFVSCGNTRKWDAKVQEAIAKGDFTLARQCAAQMNYWWDEGESTNAAYTKINRAQIAFLFNSGDTDQAYSIAQEEGYTHLFYEIFMSRLMDIYQSQGKTKIIQYIAKVEFKHSPSLGEYSYNGYKYNDSYNLAIGKYNTQLEQFMIYIDIEGDRAFNTQLLKFIKPRVEEVKKNDRSVFILNNQTQLDIKKKLKL